MEQTAAVTNEPGFGRTLWSRALIILGLSSLAVVQPLLDLFGNNPEFFVAGRYSSTQIVVFTLAITLVPPAVGVTIVAIATAVDRRAGTVAFVVVAGVFAAAFVMALLRTLEPDRALLSTIGLDPAWMVLAIAAAVASGIVWLVTRTRGGGMLARYMAAANLLFVALFMFASPASRLVAGGGATDDGNVDVPTPKGPVVVVVLDELPIATIMKSDGSINEERYPGFAELASVSNWYRNMTSNVNYSPRDVSVILSGVLPGDRDLPTSTDFPRTLFTLLGNDVPVDRYESVTSLCPTSICGEIERQPLGQAFEDASVVYGHRVLPESLRDGLPAIDNSWGDYGAQDDGGDEPQSAQGDDGVTYTEKAYAQWSARGADEKSPLGQIGTLSERVNAIGAEPSVNVTHIVSPHRPWNLSPSGEVLSYDPLPAIDADAAGFEFKTLRNFQLHSMQTGAIDVVIGDMVEHLRSLPTWEDTTLVVIADHGYNFTPPEIGRKVTPETAEEIYRVPLFIKAPGQTQGAVIDDSAQAVDVLPTMIDMLGGTTDWEFDGHSLVDGSSATNPPKVSTGVDALLDTVARREALFPEGDDWTALAAIGEHSDLVGEDVSSLEVGEPSELTASLDQESLLSDLPTSTGKMPFVLAGTVDSVDEPDGELLAAVNGRIAGVLGGYEPGVGDAWDFTGYVADFYRDGANEVTLYEVTGSGSAATLREVERT
ncbi:MAG: sulfatase-like hydrolase/transferase [Actinomycetota bacterium]|nr:sulfatase-like hydrolase/transferase [Actinomycetota bacterium]